MDGKESQTLKSVVNHLLGHPKAYDIGEAAYKTLQQYASAERVEAKAIKAAEQSVAHEANTKARESVLRGNHAVSVPLAAPVAAQSRIVMKDVKVTHGAEGKVIVSGTELIAETLLGGSTFDIAYAATIQPGLTSFLPKASAFATRFQEYRFRKLSFHMATEGATSNTGSILMGVSTDVNREKPNSKADLMAFENSTRGPPWADLRCELAKAQLGKWKKVRYGPLNNDFGPGVIPSADALAREPTFVVDYNNYDTGVLFVGRANIGTTVAYELYATYELEFRLPTLVASLIPSAVMNSPGAGNGGSIFGVANHENTKNGLIYIENQYGSTNLEIGNLVPGRHYLYVVYMQASFMATLTSTMSYATLFTYATTVTGTEIIQIGSFLALAPTVGLTVNSLATGITTALCQVSGVVTNPWI